MKHVDRRFSAGWMAALGITRSGNMNGTEVVTRSGHKKWSQGVVPDSGGKHEIFFGNSMNFGGKPSDFSENLHYFERK